MDINEMMFNTKDILTMLRNNDYIYVLRSCWGPGLYAYKSDYDNDDRLDISFLDNSFFQKYVGKRVVREIDNLLGKYQDYCNEQENKDSEY